MAAVLEAGRAADPVARCVDVDVSGGACQLVAAHKGPHASDHGNAYFTWRLGVIHRWRRDPPPAWVLNLGWAQAIEPLRCVDEGSSAVRK